MAHHVVRPKELQRLWLHFLQQATLTEQRYPAWAQAVQALEEMAIIGRFSAADVAYWNDAQLTLAICDHRGHSLSSTDVQWPFMA